jgi:hypothetical protein
MSHIIEERLTSKGEGCKKKIGLLRRTARILVALHQEAPSRGRVTAGAVTNSGCRGSVVELAEDCRILSSLG